MKIVRMFIITVVSVTSWARSADIPSEKDTKNTSPESTMNRLAKEQSPYLLQHADNPVDWYPWGTEAFQKAKELQRPIFLSIGYSTCHWCHVMEHESFEDPEVADLLNRYFISIKVDREELPEVDHVYMSVCQAMTGSGGWPLTIFMTPEKEPFFAGTYFPRDGRSNRPGMLQLLPAIQDAWQNRRDQITSSIDQIRTHLAASNKRELGELFTPELLQEAYDQFALRYDREYGGFGQSPKFPSPHNLLFLLRYHQMNQNPEALQMVETTLQNMRRGGIFDHLGFGFHRYSTDRTWLVPHFEKMLYDQALLSMTYLETFQATGESQYARTAEEIFTYVLRDMTDSQGGFYSAEDADSEGEEGKFYLWTESELASILSKNDYALLASLYTIRTQGNFSDESSRSLTGNNILHLTGSPEQIAVDQGISVETLTDRIQKIRNTLFKIRADRIRPLRDDKILTDWNGLMIASLAKGSQILSNKDYLEAAKASADFILISLRDSKGRLYKRFRKTADGPLGHLDDYAFLVWGLLELYEASFESRYLAEAVTLTEIMVEDFWDDERGGFFLGSDNAESLIVRAKTGYDGAVPSGNSVAVMNLQRLGRMIGNNRWLEMADQTMRYFSRDVQKVPTGYTHLLTAYLFEIDSPKEVVVVGDSRLEKTGLFLKSLRDSYVPSKVILFKDTALKDRQLDDIAEWTKPHIDQDGNPTIYICMNNTCNLPTQDLDLALKMLYE